jgi:hypothetical protein
VEVSGTGNDGTRERSDSWTSAGSRESRRRRNRNQRRSGSMGSVSDAPPDSVPAAPAPSMLSPHASPFTPTSSLDFPVVTPAPAPAQAALATASTATGDPYDPMSVLEAMGLPRPSPDVIEALTAAGMSRAEMAIALAAEHGVDIDIFVGALLTGVVSSQTPAPPPPPPPPPPAARHPPPTTAGAAPPPPPPPRPPPQRRLHHHRTHLGAKQPLSLRCRASRPAAE